MKPNEETDAGRVLPARVVRSRFGGISAMTLWRWVQRGILPEPISINRRNYWPESAIEAIQAKRGDDSKGGAQ